MVIKEVLQLDRWFAGRFCSWMISRGVLLLKDQFANLLRVKRRYTSAICPARPMGGSVFIRGTGAKPRFLRFKVQWLSYNYIPPDLKLRHSTFCPHSVFICFVWI